MTKGFFITFEGIDGCGKSTQSKLLFESFKKSSKDIVYTREPGGTVTSEKIRDILVNGSPDSIDKMTELLLIFASRNEHVLKKINPAIDNGSTVICDRFIDSTIAYQGYGHGIDIDLIKELHNKLIRNLYPDLTIILDIDITIALDRISLRNKNENRYEQMDISFHEKMQKGFHLIAKEDQRYILFNAKDSIESIHHQIILYINSKLKLNLTSII